jgi:hypothetical protein
LFFECVVLVTWMGMLAFASQTGSLCSFGVNTLMKGGEN